MCLGNRAPTTSHFVNKQLETIWQISVDCVAKHCDGIKPSRAEIEYGTCLAQLCVGKHNRVNPQKNDLSFYATFSPPQLKFICNHEVIFEFRIKSGHYRLDGNLAGFEDYVCSFRLPYLVHAISDNAYSKAKILVLDLKSATFLRDLSRFGKGNNFGAEDVDRHHRLITKYLTTYYLPLLNKAGFHSIYSLPDFDNLSRTHLIDFSAISEIDIGVSTISGIEINSVNIFLKSRWLEAAALVDELEDDLDHASFGQIALAENRGIYEDTCFRAFFGPPQIRVLCSKEVIYYIDVHDFHFYLNGGFQGEPQHKVSNWRIALVVDVTFYEEKSIKRLKLDFSKARVCESRCTFVTTDVEETLLVKLRTVFVQYVTRRYVTILEEYHHDHIYHVDTLVVEKEDIIDDDDEYFVPDEEIAQPGTSEFREHLRITDTFGFDLITTVTQGSINNHLRYLWKSSQGTNSCLASWSFEDFFQTTFGPPQIQLPSQPRTNSVIFYVDLRGGHLKILGPRKSRVNVEENHNFGSWKLAFEVTLKLRDNIKSDIVADSCLKGHDNVGEYVLKQLVLDFSTAKFRQDLSRLPGLFDDQNYRVMRSKRETLLYYITRYYLVELRDAGQDILYSIPTWKKTGGSGLIRYAPSSFFYQFYQVPLQQGEKISGFFSPGQNFGNRNMLVICGMLDQTRRPPFPLPRFTWQWVPSQDSFSGTVALSRKVFLEGWLLRQLTHINGRTTLVPVFHGIGDGGEWKLDLVSWEKHHMERPCDWRQIENVTGGLKFEWSNRDEWTYAHQGDRWDIYNGGYSVSCETTNNLIIPTFSRQGTCDVKLSGRIHLTLSFAGEKKQWSTTATAQWSAMLCLGGDSRGNGIKVSTSRSSEILDSSGFVGDYDIVHSGFKDASTLLKEQLSQLTFIESETIQEIESTFSGVWPLFYTGAYGYTLCNPVFDSSGDITFDLLSPLAPQGKIVVSDRRNDIVLPARRPPYSTQDYDDSRPVPRPLDDPSERPPYSTQEYHDPKPVARPLDANYKSVTPEVSFTEENSGSLNLSSSSTRVESVSPAHGKPLQNPARSYTNAKVEYYKTLNNAEEDVDGIQIVSDRKVKRTSDPRFLPEAESTVVTQRRY